MKEKIIKFFLIFLSFLAAYSIFLKVDLIRAGGPLMVPLIFSSIFGFAVIFAKMKQFSQDSLKTEGFLKIIFDHIERERIKEAIDICDKAQTPIARVLRAGIMKFDRPKDEIREAMEDALLYEMPSIEDDFSILSTIIQVAPLLGFLGTLVGIMKIVQAIQAKGGSFVAAGFFDLMPGIWEALICCATAFIIAIVLLVAHNYLRSRAKSLFDEIERGATELIIFLMDRRMPA